MPVSKKITVRLCGALCLALAVSAALPAAAEPETGEPADGPARTVSAADVRADFAALYDGLQAAHFDLYANVSKAEYDALFREMADRIHGPMSLFDTTLMFQAFTAHGNVAHATIELSPLILHNFSEAGGAGMFPLQPRVEEGQLFVGRNLSGVGDIAPGDEILSIDGRPAAEVLAQMGRYVSADTAYMKRAIIESGFIERMMLSPGPRQRFDVTIAHASGEVISHDLPGLSVDEFYAASEGQARANLSFEERRAAMLADGIAYLRPGPFYAYETPHEPMEADDFIRFIDESFARSSRPERVI